jgi:hypothetical protein
MASTEATVTFAVPHLTPPPKKKKNQNTILMSVNTKTYPTRIKLELKFHSNTIKM